ncbi:inactive protein RESTRICTED TEV MOVEMENT 2-like [Hordeum vulgare subsp. vulgare]|uniref:SHSP domain-containing protein n=1 Tax=Hordeum vulgare subsp. vulgare TaxID=112509 RepID=A0A8I6WZ28_HORVV|nr:inactive protein RESTRICTED TEV MOVEMENT 2-like [Hordeum vulgare subsp. vulgare]
MARDMASRQESPAAAADWDYEWVHGDGGYLLRLNLPGLKKEEFRVHVDAAGRLDILGPSTADGGAGKMRLHQVFQLPATSDLDAITGRYNANVLTLTVPKLSSAPPKGKEASNSSDVGDQPTDKKSKLSREAERLIEAAMARLQGRHKQETAKEQSSKEPPATKVDQREKEPKAEKVVKGDDGQDGKAKAAAAPQHKEKLECETTQRQREKKGCWKERAAEEGFKWADAIGKNKEVIAATAVAAFTLGVFVSHRLFSRN